MVDSRPPFRADHVGSLLRPPAVEQEREKLLLGLGLARDAWGSL